MPYLSRTKDSRLETSLYYGYAQDGIDGRAPAAITEVPGGATNIEMSGGTYYGNKENNLGQQDTTNLGFRPLITRTRLINFIHIRDSYFHDMVIENASDDNFSLGQNATYNQCRNLVSRGAGLSPGDLSGNALTDRGDYNRWYDCIAEDCTSDGWTPKCRNSEFHRCIARRNAGPGFGLYALVDGLPKGQDRGQVLEGNKFYACEAYDNIRSGFSINVCSDGCPGAIVRNNYIQGAFHNNGMSGVLIRNVGAGTVEDNQLDILVFGNGNSNSELSGAGLFVEANSSSPVCRILWYTNTKSLSL